MVGQTVWLPLALLRPSSLLEGYRCRMDEREKASTTPKMRLIESEPISRFEPSFPPSSRFVSFLFLSLTQTEVESGAPTSSPHSSTCASPPSRRAAGRPLGFRSDGEEEAIPRCGLDAAATLESDAVYSRYIAQFSSPSLPSSPFSFAEMKMVLRSRTQGRGRRLRRRRRRRCRRSGGGGW